MFIKLWLEHLCRLVKGTMWCSNWQEARQWEGKSAKFAWLFILINRLGSPLLVGWWLGVVAILPFIGDKSARVCVCWCLSGKCRSVVIVNGAWLVGVLINISESHRQAIQKSSPSALELVVAADCAEDEAVKLGWRLHRWVLFRRYGTMCARRPSCMERQQCRSTTTASVGDFNDRLFVGLRMLRWNQVFQEWLDQGSYRLCA